MLEFKCTTANAYLAFLNCYLVNFLTCAATVMS